MATRTSYGHGEFCWTDLATPDYAAAERFYGRLMGWRCEKRPPSGAGHGPYGMFHLEGRYVAGLGELSAEMKAAGVPPMWNSYVSVKDIDELVDRATRLGATLSVPVMDITGAGRLAFLLDPGGANLGLWEPGEHCGASLVNEPGAFCWHELRTRDLEAAKAFYGELFGWQYEQSPESPVPYPVVLNEGVRIGGMLEITPEWGDVAPHWSVYFAVSDISAALDTLRELGGAPHCEPIAIAPGRFAPVSDDQGAPFTLIELSAPE